MSKYVIDSSTLVGIADSIRSKKGSTAPIKVEDFAKQISSISGGELDVKAILEDAVSLESLNYYGLLDKYYDGDSIELHLAPTKVGGGSVLGYSTLCEDIDIDIDLTNMGGGSSALNYFLRNSEVKKVTLHIHDFPSNFRFTGLGYFFSECHNLEEVNEDIFDFVDDMQAMTSKTNGLFQNCYSLKKLPDSMYKMQIASKSTSMYWGLSGLYSIKKMEIPICMSTDPNGFMVYQSEFANLSMLEHLIITNPNNIQYTGAVSSSASYLTLNMTTYAGYFSSATTANNVPKIKDGTIPRVTNDATYEQYKNGDYWTTDINYSHYNKQSAIETLQSLPDMSGWGFVFTVKFRGASGSKTDGGAINTMTEEEIAIATDKNWTVQFA